MVRLLLILVLTSGSAQADSCGTVDLREDRCPNGSSRLPSPRSQARTNYCFAFALTNLYSHANCVAYSPISTGLLTNQIFASSGAAAMLQKPGGTGNPNTLNRGFGPMQADELIRNAQMGPCLEADFPSERIVLPEDKSKCPIVEPFVQVEEILRSMVAITDGLTFPLRCSSRPVQNVNLALQTENTESAIHLALDRGQVAVVHLNSALFSVNQLLPRGGDHYVTVIGRRMVNGSCHLLVRDSNRANPESPWQTEGDYDHWIPQSNVLSTVDEVIQQR